MGDGKPAFAGALATGSAACELSPGIALALAALIPRMSESEAVATTDFLIKLWIMLSIPRQAGNVESWQISTLRHPRERVGE